jgi:hypothetical protein
MTRSTNTKTAAKDAEVTSKANGKGASVEPIRKDRLLAFNKRLRSKYRPTAEDFWLLMGVSVPEQVEKLRVGSVSLLGELKARNGSTERDAGINRAIVESLRVLETYGAGPPTEFIELIAHQLRVAGTPRRSRKDDIKWRKTVALIAGDAGLSNRAVGKHSGVDPKTVANWRADARFLRDVAAEVNLRSIRSQAQASKARNK